MTINEIRTIELRFNELHQPIVVLPTKGKLELLVQESTMAGEMNDILLSGNSEALYALGNLLIAISETPGYHMHLDGDAEREWFRCREGVMLTIANSDKVPPKQNRISNELPPDWAQG